MKEILCDLTLYAAIFSMAVPIGGAIYQMMVVMPVWTKSLPDSLLAFNRTDVNPSAFWTSPLLRGMAMLSTLAALIVNWATPRQNWVLASFLLFILAVVATVAYFIPRLKLMGLLGGKALEDPEALTRTVRNWIFADKFRLCLLMLPAFFLLLKALGTPMATNY